MVHHSDCIGYNCYSDKPKYHYNPLPRFKFPVKTTTAATNAVSDAVTTFITDTLKPITEEVVVTPNITTTAIRRTTTETITSTVEQIADVFNSSLTDIIDFTSNNTLINEENTSDNGIIVGVMEGVSNSSITDIMHNATVQINNDASSTAGNIEEITNAMPDIVTSTTESTISFIQSSTAKVMDFVTTNIFENSKFDGHFKHHHSDDHNSHTSIYAILGIILAILILIVVIVILIYIRYRKSKSHSVHNQYYEITTKKENVPTTTEDDNSKDYVNDVYVQYPC